MSQGQGESPLAPRRIAIVERRRKALDLRKAGASFPDISRQLGCSVSTAYRMVEWSLQKTLQEPADEVRKLELERLDRLLLALWPDAVNGDKDAIDRVLKIQARRAALLGLDIARQEITHSSDPASPFKVYLNIDPAQV